MAQRGSPILQPLPIRNTTSLNLGTPPGYVQICVLAPYIVRNDILVDPFRLKVIRTTRTDGDLFDEPGQVRVMGTDDSGSLCVIVLRTTNWAIVERLGSEQSTWIGPWRYYDGRVY